MGGQPRCLPRGVLLQPHQEPKGHIPETPQRGPSTHRSPLTPQADDGGQIVCTTPPARTEHNAQALAWEHRAQPLGHRNRPRRRARPPNGRRTCAHSLHPQTRRYTHTAKHRETGRQKQPTTCAHTLPTNIKNTDSPRKGPRARTSRPGRAPSPSSAPQPGDPRHPATACRRPRARGTRTPPQALPWARGSGEDTPAPGSAPAMMDRLTKAPATSPVSSCRSD